MPAEVAAAIVLLGALALAGSVRAGRVPRRRIPLLRIPAALLAAMTTALEGPAFVAALAIVFAAAAYVAWCYWSAPPVPAERWHPRWAERRDEPAAAAALPEPGPRELYAVEVELLDGSRHPYRAVTRLGPAVATALAVAQLAEDLDLEPAALRASGQVVDHTVEALGPVAGTDVPPGALADPYES